MTQLKAVAGRTEFDRTTAPRPIDGRPGEFAVFLDAGWSSLVGMHGGYMSALAVRGAESVSTDRTVRTTATSFLRAGRVGPARLSIRELRRGQTLSTMTAELVQDDRVLQVTRLTAMTDRAGIDWSERRPVELRPPADCVPFVPPDHVVSFGRFELRFDPDRLPFSGPRAEITGYVRPLEGRPVDAAWLVMAADCFPPPAFARTDVPIGGMSIDMTVHVHRRGLRLPDDGWLVGSFEIADSKGGLAVETGCITRMDGTAVAESFQTRLTMAR